MSIGLNASALSTSGTQTRAQLYPQKVIDLAPALGHPDTRTEAAEAIRGLIDAIVLTPAERALENHIVRRGARQRARSG